MNIFLKYCILTVVICSSCAHDEEVKKVSAVSPGDEFILSSQKASFVETPDEKDLTTRLDEIDSQLAENSGDSDLVKQKMDLQLLLGKNAEAIKSGKLLLMQGIEESGVHMRIALAALKDRKYGLAEYILNRPICEKDSDCQNLLGVLSYVKQKIPEAVNYFKKSITLNQKNISPSLNLALVYIEYHKYDDAWDEINGVLKLDKNNTNALMHKAILLNLRNENVKALEIYNSIADSDPGNAVMLFNSAVLLYQEKDYESALKKLKKSLKSAQEYQINLDPLIKLKEEIKVQKKISEK